MTEHLTRGALISRLERHGLRVRGTPLALDDKRMAMLRERGEDVNAEPKPTGGDHVGR